MHGSMGVYRGRSGHYLPVQSKTCATQKLSPGLCGDSFKPVFMMKTTQNVP